MRDPLSRYAVRFAVLGLAVAVPLGCRSTGGVARGVENGASAANTVSEAELNRDPAASIGTALESKVPGVQVIYVGGEPRVLIRGVRTLTGDPYALVVVDGQATSLSAVNPRDIQSIRILKGSAATIYGLRGGNGVVEITTKRAE